MANDPKRISRSDVNSDRIERAEKYHIIEKAEQSWTVGDKVFTEFSDALRQVAINKLSDALAAKGIAPDAKLMQALASIAPSLAEFAATIMQQGRNRARPSVRSVRRKPF